jgi:hypothetical protein
MAVNETGRDAIADALVAADIAEHAPTASQTATFAMPEFGVPDFPGDMTMATQSFNAPAGHMVGETGPLAGSGGNLLSSPEGGRGTPGSPGFHSPGFDMFGAPSTPATPDFANSGNLFEGGFNTFGGQYDPADMFGASPDFTTSPSFNSTPGVPTDPGDPFGNSDQIASNNAMVADMVAAMAGDLGLGDTGADGSDSSSDSSGDSSGSEGASGGVG